MAKVYKDGKEVEGRSVVTESQARASEHWQAKHGSEEKSARVAKRQTARTARTPQEQIALLDQRLDTGQNAKKERARLA
jgi:hypothetical protein